MGSMSTIPGPPGPDDCWGGGGCPQPVGWWVSGTRATEDPREYRSIGRFGVCSSHLVRFLRRHGDGPHLVTAVEIEGPRQEVEVLPAGVTRKRPNLTPLTDEQLHLVADLYNEAVALRKQIGRYVAAGQPDRPSVNASNARIHAARRRGFLPPVSR